jgi:hypothetical protein
MTMVHCRPWPWQIIEMPHGVCTIRQKLMLANSGSLPGRLRVPAAKSSGPSWRFIPTAL